LAFAAGCVERCEERRDADREGAFSTSGSRHHRDDALLLISGVRADWKQGEWNSISTCAARRAV
jgi:hypothetical protein